ncbi:caspase family protein [Bradyrhizobium rifense]|uniref:Caspase family protein n=1 Tax=Bradyrhizobium rifense TaxID=515499 RepID=A0A5D3KGV8_9BRAD|nr:caspase family protein [Bradyrhizobium rifense]TYL92732.1 caspase family protein [Bradyrhizobium rifense]
MRITTTALFLVLLFCLQQPASAESRVALVVGNGSYEKVPELPNPPRDATDIGRALERLNFKVSLIKNATAQEMRKAVIEFGRAAEGADMAVVFYAGHGMEVGGENWLIPIGAELRSDADIESEAISLRSVSAQVSKARQLGLIILDACRNNPFAAKMKRSLSTRGVSRGLAPSEPSDNVLVAYAARDGTTASDGDGRNSPFTTALLRHLETPGLEISFLFRRVRDDVMMATKREQQPFVYGSLSKEEIYLNTKTKTELQSRVQPSTLSIERQSTTDQTQDASRSGATLAIAQTQDVRISASINFSSFRTRPKPRRTRSSVKMDFVVTTSGKVEETIQETGKFAERTTTRQGPLGAQFQILDANTIQRIRKFEDRTQTLTIAFAGRRCRATLTNEPNSGFTEWEGRSTELGQQAFYKDWAMTSSTCAIR